MKNQLILINQMLRKQYCLKKIHVVIKVHINTLLNIYKGNALPSQLCIKFPQMNEFVKYFDKNSKYKNLLVNDKKIRNTQSIIKEY